jgi:hypothetical protein
LDLLLRFTIPIAIIALLASGCERISRARQCSSLVDSVNQTMDALKEEAEQALSPESLQRSARHYTVLADVLGPMEFNDRQMAVDVEAFRRLLVRAAELCVELSQARRQNEWARAALLKKELGALRTPMKASAYKMNTWCHAP